ncbi:MAG: hypothetical protein V4650_08545 [Pseudomonadota bacterium]
MTVDDAFLEDALLNLYATCIFGRSDHAMHAGATLDIGSLREEWRAYHLRQDDLDRALEILVSKGELSRSGSADAALYAITKKGLRRGREGRGPSLGARWQTMKDVAKLSWAQSRDDHGQPDALLQRRRAADQVSLLSPRQFDSLP